MARILLEVCTGSLEDSLIAAKGGADRIELNTSLTLGGLTPSLGTVQRVRDRVRLPLIVMIRPREGGFCYSPDEFETMLADVEALSGVGVDGFALGILHPNRELDLDRCGEIRRRIGNLQAVFHRAFDFTPNPAQALEQLIDLGFTRVLTSGQQATALEGAERLTQLIHQAKGRIEILPASGIQPVNVPKLLSQVPCSQIHCSLKSPKIDDSVPRNESISFSNLTDGVYYQTDLAKVVNIRKILDSLTEMAESRLV